MTSLYDIYSKTIMSGNWEYYPFPDKTGTEVLSNSEDGKCFIRSYLGKGSKTDVDIYEYIDKLSDDRICHILSCFFLGVAIYNYCNKIRSNIDNELNSIPANPKETPNERFLYVWMLISIFHDFGYAVEDGLLQIKKEEINYLLKGMSRRPRFIPNLYSKKLLLNYNKYKNCRFGKNDHGIIGGIKLFHDLCHLREKKVNVDSDHFWERPLINDFKIASWTIACHNIFMIEEKSVFRGCYSHFSLDKLVYKKISRNISPDKNPILFFFCLIDSIEPIKTIHNHKKLANILIDIKDNGIEFDFSKLCPVMEKQLRERIQGLNSWLTNISNDGTIICI